MESVDPARLERDLDGLEFPATRDELLRHVDARGLPYEVRATLERLPEATFETPAEVTEAVGVLT